MRVELYRVVHKALRSQLFDLSVELARCDFGNPSEIHVALRAYRRTVGFLREHHAHEDTFCHTALAERVPRVVVATQDQHDALEQQLSDLDHAVSTIESEKVDADGATRANEGVVSRFDAFLSAYLPHL